MVNFRWIEQGDKGGLDRLKPVMEEFGWTPLNPYFSKALIAENEQGQIVGFNVLQMVARPEPLWVAKQYRGEMSGLASELAAQMIEHLREAQCPYWAIKTESPYVERLCIANRMKMSDVPFYEGGS